MRILKTLLLMIAIMVLPIACNRNTSSITIKSTGDTISLNNLFRAEIYLKYNALKVPEFTFTFKSDTFLIPFDEIKGCGVFQAISRYEGENIYDGNVNYLNSDGLQKNEKIVIKFYVIP